MAYSFPNVSFDWLGELPGIAEEARGRTTRREALADLDTSDPKSLEDRAAKLFATGSKENMEIGLRLQAAALARRELSRKSASDAQYREMLPFLLQANRSLTGGGQTPGSTYDPFGGMTETPPAAPAAPAPAIPWGPNPLGPQSGLPPGTPMSAAASPSEELLARAEGSAPVPMPGPQFAQAGPPPAPPTAAVPPWLQGAQAAPMQVPQQAPVQPAARPAFGPVEDRAAQAEVSRIAEMLLSLPKNAPAGAVRALTGRFTNALDRLQMTPEQKNYQVDRLQRLRAGEPDISISDWRLEEKVAPKRFEEAQKLYLGIKGEETKSRGLRDILTQMEAITQHPQFASGAGTPIFQRGVSFLSGLRDLAQVLGVPDRFLPDLTKITTPAALMEAYTALSNQAVFAKVGTLGNQISEGDRNFVTASFPTLSTSVLGNRLLTRIMKQVADHTIKSGQVAQKYQMSKGPRATPEGLNDVMEKWADENRLFTNKDGSLNEAGKRLQEEIDSVTRQPPPASVVPPASTSAPAAGRPVIGPDGKRYRFLNGQLIPEQE